MLKTSLEKYSEQLARENQRKSIQDELRQKTAAEALDLLNKKISIKEISEITGLTNEEIEKLAE